MGVSRRQVLQTTGALAAASLVGACGSSTPPDAGLAGANPLPLLPRFVLTDAQRATLEAATARLVPAGDATDWSAADAGAVEYIEQLLNAFSEPGNPKIFGGGPV